MTRASVTAAPWPSSSALLELFKPVTWFPPMWAFACGAVSSGVAFEGRWLLIAAGVLLAGPLLCAASQATNDWFDRHVDAINEPQRPIPSGRVPGRWGLYLAIFWSALALGVAALLGPWVLAAATLGVALSWAYSAPPLRLKLNGWWGNAAVGVSYEGLAWVTGAALMLNDLPRIEILLLAALYSVGAHGIMTLNDFKSIGGDRKMGVRTLPVQLGEFKAAVVACLMMAVPQMFVFKLLLLRGHSLHGLAVAALVAVQAGLMWRFLQQPRERALWYSAVGINFFVAGMLVSAFAVRSA